MLVGVSFLKNKNGYQKTIDDINNSIADYIHVDIMDNVFVNNRTIDYEEAKELLNESKKKLDIHLMVDDAYPYILDYINLKPEYITFHIESNSDVNKCIKLIKDNYIKVGIALSPKTRIFNILPYINEIDQVLVMSVEPGMGGQKFIDSSVNTINELKALQKKYHYIINVDGGINDTTIKNVNSDMVVSGSFITMSDDYNTNIRLLKE